MTHSLYYFTEEKKTLRLQNLSKFTNPSAFLSSPPLPLALPRFPAPSPAFPPPKKKKDISLLFIIRKKTKVPKLLYKAQNLANIPENGEKKRTDLLKKAKTAIIGIMTNATRTINEDMWNWRDTGPGQNWCCELIDSVIGSSPDGPLLTQRQHRPSLPSELRLVVSLAAVTVLWSTNSALSTNGYLEVFQVISSLTGIQIFESNGFSPKSIISTFF